MLDSHRVLNKMSTLVYHKPQSNPVSLKNNTLMKRPLNLTHKNGNAIIPITSSEAMERALAVRANLSPHFPNFVKVMLRSHVSGCYWMGLERQFCISCLPNHNVDVVLVDEDGKEYTNIYLAHRYGLSGGWRAFVIDKKLEIDDVVIFQCVEPCKLKVYIVRANMLAEVDGVVSFPQLNHHAQPIETADEFSGESHNSNITNSDSEILEGERLFQQDVNFRDVKKFEDFTIQVDCLNLDSKIPTHLRRKYYELCSSQNMFLHKNLTEGLNQNLATGVISEMINIADAIREVNHTKISITDLEDWDRTLNAFGNLGMRVGFLRDRISKLIDLYRKYQSVITLTQCEKHEAENEMRYLNDKLRSVWARVKMLNLKINEENGKLDSKLLKVARDSW